MFDDPGFEQLTHVQGDPFPLSTFEQDPADVPRETDPSASWRAADEEYDHA